MAGRLRSSGNSVRNLPSVRPKDVLYFRFGQGENRALAVPFSYELQSVYKVNVNTLNNVLSKKAIANL